MEQELNAAFWKALAFGVLRTALAGASGLLITKGYLTEGQNELLLLGAAALVVALVASLVNKMRVRELLGASLQAPEGSNLSDAKALLDEKRRPPSSLYSILLACVVVGGAVPQAACDESEVNKFASVSVEGQRGVADGIVVARALREAGKVTPAKNLSLARRARTVVSLHLAAVNLALESGTDGVEAKPLADQIEAVLNEADRLIHDGTVELDGTQRLIFDLSASLARNRLQSVVDELRSKPGVRIVVGEKARAKLEETKRAADRNLKALDAAIELLGRG